MTGKVRLIGDSGFDSVCLKEAFVRVWRMIGLRCSGCGGLSKDAFWDVLLALEVHRKDDVSAGTVAEVSAWSWKCGEGLNCALQTSPGLGLVGGS